MGDGVGRWLGGPAPGALAHNEQDARRGRTDVHASLPPDKTPVKDGPAARGCSNISAKANATGMGERARPVVVADRRRGRGAGRRHGRVVADGDLDGSWTSDDRSPSRQPAERAGEPPASGSGKDGHVDIGARVVGPLLDLFLPPVCPGCGIEGDPLCTTCWRPFERRLAAPPGTPIGLEPVLPPPLLQLEWSAPYEGSVRAALHDHPERLRVMSENARALFHERFA
ncbi:MAG: hypothetical protein C4343_02005, partial [Chloroflexota bacterium]